MTTLPDPDTFHKQWVTRMNLDPYAELRLAYAYGKTIQANRGTRSQPEWVDLDEPQFTCEADMYRVSPEDA